MDELEQDQADITALLNGDSVFTNVAVIAEKKGDIETDIAQALATVNEKAGKTGACVVVLQPAELPTDADTSNPELRVRFHVQCFDQPLFNDDETTGTGQTVWSLARRVRQLLHFRHFGTGTYVWKGTEDAPQADPGRRSRIVSFERLGAEDPFTRLSRPLIEPEEGGAVPQSVTIQAQPGAAIYYTLDGSFPSSTNPEAELYAGALNITEAATLRAVAYLAGALPSDVAHAVFS
jgi:hypothetical protein